MLSRLLIEIDSYLIGGELSTILEYKVCAFQACPAWLDDDRFSILKSCGVFTVTVELLDNNTVKFVTNTY